MLTKHIIDQQTYLANPNQYSDYVIMSARRYAELEEIEIAQAIQQGKKDFAEGRSRPYTEVFSALDKRIKELENLT